MQHLSRSAKIGLFWVILLSFAIAVTAVSPDPPVFAQDAVPAVTDTATAEPTPPSSPTATTVPPTPTGATTEPPTPTPPTPGVTPTDTPPVPPTATPPPSEPVQIPEPITVVLFGTGLAALSAAAASRRKAE